MRLLACLSLGLFILGAGASSRGSWPCPEPEEIAPCNCTAGATGDINMDCSNVQTDEELSRAFRANFPFTDLNKFTMIKSLSENKIGVTRLGAETFGNVSFTNIAISHTTLNVVEDLAFSKSFDMLEILIISYSELASFPFDVLRNCPKLRDLRVFNNQIKHMSNIHSDSLEYLQVSHNPELHFNDDTFQTAPGLKHLLLNTVDLQYVAPDTFAALRNLEILDLSDNKITSLVPDSLRFTSPVVREIKLQANSIETLERSFISGLSSGTFLWMQHNSLTELPENVWKDVFDSVASAASKDLFVIDDNPIRCDCHIKWLVSSPTYLEILGKKASCDDGTFLNDATLGNFIIQHCP